MTRDLSPRTIRTCLSAAVIVTFLWDAAVVAVVASVGLSWLL